MDKRDEVRLCPSCTWGSMERWFTPTRYLYAPRAFRETSTANWHLPPRGDPRWEGMDKEGRTRAQAPPETLRQYIDREGLIP